MDPLSGVLSLLKPRNTMCGGFDVGGEWSLQFPEHEGIKCYAIVGGQCWLVVEGVSQAVRLKSGDCFLLPLGRPFRLTSDLALPPVDFKAMHSRPMNGGFAVWNGGGDVSGVGGYIGLEGKHAGILLKMLPPIVHIRKEADKLALRWSIERMMQELREPQPGGHLVIQHLAHMMLVQALRAHLAEGSRGGVGWLFALADEQIGPAINAMHAAPAHPWTLQELAERVGMSRSGFAQKFKETVGATPIDYLTRWRMLLAGDRLTSSGDPISAISLSLGYESESAFSTAFKRVMGCSPRQYSRGRDRVTSHHGVLAD
ncbi:AraC family transcriptional regulator [Paludisphaera mucosa]|uniref:AraC family transcriptional regulator n=1 Tax=Paludisphaera mucosa TaxID=3030827 RepID=A0ABT6FG54_9BACT|nr:AraC family transcriptional regulator [Paludisphaera mucosa]MDG3006370.1 AraC family transcriptional regulator [Paludisphaera mucosa]